MNIGIYTNLKRDIDGKATKALFNILYEKKIGVLLSDELQCLNIPNVTYCNKNDLAKNSDIIFVFGGDGTILRIAKECSINKSLIFAVNLGHMGFLAEVEDIDLKNVVELILQNKYSLDKRSMLKVKCNNNTYIALNEVVLARGSRTRLIKCCVKVDGSLLDKYSADGVIISTPTGSTAYSLSAGGPIVAPGVKAMIVTPICPHSLNSRPYVIPENDNVTIELFEVENEAHLNVDGDDVCNLYANDIIEVTTSELSCDFIRLEHYNYFEKLLAKATNWRSIK